MALDVAALVRSLALPDPVHVIGGSVASMIRQAHVIHYTLNPIFKSQSQPCDLAMTIRRGPSHRVLARRRGGAAVGGGARSPLLATSVLTCVTSVPWSNEWAGSQLPIYLFFQSFSSLSVHLR